jgi:hypothetical protein
MKRIILLSIILIFAATAVSNARPFGPAGRGSACRNPVMSQLTWDQRAEIRDMVYQMRLGGSTPDEVQEAVKSKLESFGVEVPADWGMRRGMRGRRGAPHMRMIMAQLTDDQRAAVREKTEQMINEGATPLQIREEVGRMLKEFGVEPPAGCRLNSDDTQSGAVVPMNSGQVDQPVLATANYPNPFNPETTIAYELQEPQQVSVAIYDIQGQRVRTLVDGYQNSGAYEIVWNGCDESGARVSSGTYFYTVNAGDQTATKQMILLK